MSSAKRRGQARGQDTPGGNASGRRGGRDRGNTPRGRAAPVTPFDGPASRGSGSGAGTQSQISGPAGGSRRGSTARSQTGAPSTTASQPAAQASGPPPRDPAREGPAPRRTDVIKNVDMPASFYNIDGLVSQPISSFHWRFRTQI